MLHRKIDSAIAGVRAVQDTEVVCSEFFAHLAHYVDLELRGIDACQKLPAIAQHLHQCPECEEVHTAVLAAAGKGDTAAV